MNKYNVGDIIVYEDGLMYTITQILRFIDDSYGYDTEYYDKDNQTVLPYYMSEVHINNILSGKYEEQVKYYPVKKD